MRKILVAIDGSESCNKAAKEAKELALLCKSSVTFITVVDRDFRIIKSQEEFETLEEDIKKKKIESEDFLIKCNEIYKKCENSLEEEGLLINNVVKEGGHPAEVICNYAEENNFDLIVMADKGESNIKKFLLGSTTEKVIRHSKTSILVVK